MKKQKKISRFDKLLRDDQEKWLTEQIEGFKVISGFGRVDKKGLKRTVYPNFKQYKGKDKIDFKDGYIWVSKKIFNLIKKFKKTKIKT